MGIFNWLKQKFVSNDEAYNAELPKTKVIKSRKKKEVVYSELPQLTKVITTPTHQTTIIDATLSIEPVVKKTSEVKVEKPKKEKKKKEPKKKQAKLGTVFTASINTKEYKIGCGDKKGKSKKNDVTETQDSVIIKDEKSE